MIILTKLKGQKFALNEDNIETIQENPDTTIKLFNGNIYIVEEPMDVVMDLISDYKRYVR